MSQPSRPPSSGASPAPPAPAAWQRALAALSDQWQGLSLRSQTVLGYWFPLLTVLLFTLVVLGAYLFLRMEEKAREAQALSQRSQLLALRLSEQLLGKQEDIQRIASALAGQAAQAGERGLEGHARALMARDATLYALRLVDAGQREIITVHSAMHARLAGLPAPAVAVGERRPSRWALVRTVPAPGSSAPVEPPILPDAPVFDADEASATNGAGNGAGQGGAGQAVVLRLYTPLYAHDMYLGAVVADYLPQLLLGATLLHQEGAAEIAVSLLDASGRRVAALGVQASHDALGSPLAHTSLPVAPLGERLRLHATLYRSDGNLIGSALLVLLMLLGLTTSVTLLLNWRLSRHRLHDQRKLQEEASFRMAIENALITGIRVLDLDGVTTYTNAAFSRMVGWSQQEMVGMRAPFPYWQPKDREVLMERFRAELAGQHYPHGLQLRMRRRNGTAFDARIHLVPLRDALGAQTGWLTTITDITEPNRIRQQLSAAHERFTLVLEALDASISVAPLGSQELLFANRMYRQWFGADSRGHLRMLAGASAMHAGASGGDAGSESERAHDELANDERANGEVGKAGDAIDQEDALMGLPAQSITSANSERAEIYVQSLDKWLEVRSRYLDWVDGRLAQMLIATDITARKLAQEQAARQVAKMETVSRLMTMGEMASSVAHELNQPLAAISNYTNGMIARIQSGSIDLQGLLMPLEKTAHQAIRAGQVIQRIRSFVKRSESRSEICLPHRLVSEAVELANIEIRKRNARLHVLMEPNLPPLEVDAILIEQVLINLLKNAAEAMDGADTPQAQRHIELRLMHHAGESGQGAGVRFVVADQGPGLPEESLAHLFDAFYSTKRDGMGIGLNLCRSIIETHHGQLQVRNIYNRPPPGTPEEGTPEETPSDGGGSSDSGHNTVSGCEFSFWLPAWQGQHGSDAQQPSQPILG